MVSRFVRIIVFFDLPVMTVAQRKEYTKFRRNLIKEGYLMMQESVYTKLAINRQTMELEMKRIFSFLPKHGLVQALTVTEKQFSKMKTLLGEGYKRPEIDTTERLIIL